MYESDSSNSPSQPQFGGEPPSELGAQPASSSAFPIHNQAPTDHEMHEEAYPPVSTPLPSSAPSGIPPYPPQRSPSISSGFQPYGPQTGGGHLPSAGYAPANHPPTGYQAPPPYTPAPSKKKLTRGQWILAFTGGLLIVCCLCGTIAALGDKASPSTVQQTTGSDVSSTPTVEGTPLPTDTPEPTPTNTPAPRWVTIAKFSGNGTKRTAKFTITADQWRINWSCNPSSDYFGEYNVIVSVYNDDGTPDDYAAINTICQAGNTHDSTAEYTSGMFYLEVDSEGAWSIQIQAFQ